MKIIITCDDDKLPAALRLLDAELAKPNWKKSFDRPGWGWHMYMPDARFFVRGIVGGISLTQVKRVK